MSRLAELREGTRIPGVAEPGGDAAWAIGMVGSAEVALTWSGEQVHVLAPIDPPLLAGLCLRERTPADLAKAEITGRYRLAGPRPYDDSIVGSALHVDGAVALFSAPGSGHPYRPLAALSARGVRFVVRDHCVRLVGDKSRTAALADDAASLARGFAARRAATAGATAWEKALGGVWRGVGDGFGLTFDAARMRLEGRHQGVGLLVALGTDEAEYVTSIVASLARAPADVVCTPRRNPIGWSFLERFSVHAPGAVSGAWPPEEVRAALITLLARGDHVELRGSRVRVRMRTAIGEAHPLTEAIATALAVGRSVEGMSPGSPYR